MYIYAIYIHLFTYSKQDDGNTIDLVLRASCYQFLPK